MTFPTSAYLRKATSRAKSDVANKLVSMFLHDLSRRITASLQLSITDATYAEAVATAFGTDCCYCSCPLEIDRAAVEHLDGMNRFRLGLHIPGNVIVACKRCNGEKRRDDQVIKLTLAETGWESFLSHDSRRCPAVCLNCAYWRNVWPGADQCVENTERARAKIAAFRAEYPEFLSWSRRAQDCLRPIVDSLYRDCQEFAAAEIKKTAEKAFETLAETNSPIQNL